MNVENFLIKKMTNEHISDILFIEEMCFEDPWNEQMFLGELEHENVYYFIIIKDNKPVGYIGFWHIVDEGHITNICIDKTLQKQGLGTKLMEYAIEAMKSLEIIATTLEVRQSNLKAINFYNKLGFTSEGVRKNYYSNPKEDAVIMWKKLKN